MARKRRTDITSSNDGGDEEAGNNKMPGKITTRRPVSGKSPTVKRVPDPAKKRVTTGPHSPVAGRMARTKKSGKNSMITYAVVAGIVVVLGIIAWRVQAHYAEVEQQKIREEKERLAAEAEKEKLRLMREAEAKKREEARKKQLAAEEKLKEMEEQERKARLAQEKAEKERLEKQRKAELDMKAKAAEAARVKAVQDELNNAVKEAKEVAAKGDFAKAANIINSKLGGDAGDKKTAQEYHRSFQKFALAVSEVKPGPDAIAKDMYDFVLKDGNEIRAKVERQGITDITIIKNGGIKLILERKRIVSQKAVKQEDIDKANREKVIVKAKEATTSVEFYAIGVYALELGQNELMLKAFNKAIELDPNVAGNVYEFEARKLFASGAFDRSLKNIKAAQRKFDKLSKVYPDSKANAMLKGAVEEESKVIAMLSKSKAKDGAAGAAKDSAGAGDNETMQSISSEMEKAKEGVTATGANAIKLADKLSAEAADLEKQAQSAGSRKDSNVFYKEAVKKLTQALVLYQNFLDKNDDEAVSAKLQDATRRYYWCKKLQTL